MFRKDENARLEWSPAQVAVCAARQDQILDCAAAMVRPGGRILYSTCTFSPEENEQTAARFLVRHPEFCLERPRAAGFFSEGRPEWAESVGLKEQRDELRKTVRIWPHETGGEGHFMALFVKNGDGAGDSGGMENRPMPWPCFLKRKTSSSGQSLGRERPRQSISGARP